MSNAPVTVGMSALFGWFTTNAVVAVVDASPPASYGYALGAAATAVGLVLSFLTFLDRKIDKSNEVERKLTEEKFKVMHQEIKVIGQRVEALYRHITGKVDAPPPDL